ncbi:MAG: glycosyltransferase [Chloroflexi bacterium]|nr:glycosyltransferase [Chloroflexota bacterium]
MRVSIIIPSLNSPLIHRVIAHLQAQTAADQIGEILIVGRDEHKLVPAGANIRLIDTGQPVNSAIARNLGIKAAQHDLLLFLDSDCLPQPDWLAHHLQAQTEGHAVVGGGVLPEGETYWSLSYNLAIFHEYFSTNPARLYPYLPTLNLSVQRHVIAQVGGLNPDLPRAHDIEWTVRMRRAGFDLYFWPAAAVYHQHNRTTFARVWQDCAHSGFYMRQIRLNHADWLPAPGWLRSRPLILLLAPFIAAGVSGKIVATRPRTFLHHWTTLPALYLTKLAWCWGAAAWSKD